MMVRGLTAGKPSSTGLTYPVVLIALLVISIQASVTVPLASTQARRGQEQELLFRGQAYQRAIAAYYRARPDMPQYPPSLDALLRDPRFPLRRHLRQAYGDPVSGDDWLLIRAPDGGVAGVASASGASTIKRGNFPPGLETFEAAVTYRDWQFVFVPGQ